MGNEDASLAIIPQSNLPEERSVMPLSQSAVIEEIEPSPPIGLDTVIGRLRTARAEWRQSQARHAEYGEHGFPSRHAIARIIDSLSAALFPLRLGPAELTLDSEDAFVRASLETALPLLVAQVRMELAYREAPLVEGEERELAAERIIRSLANALPEIRRLLDTDLEAAYLGDPAARSVDEVLLCYPCVTAVIHHRIAHELYLLGAPLTARIIADDRGLADDDPRHPIVEDDVTIYSGATILGRITVGKGSVIGGNVWLTRSVPPGSRVRQSQPSVDVEAADPFE